jgi:hypothetical protein
MKHDIAEYEIEGSGINSTTKREIVWKNKQTGEVTFAIPAGVRVHVDFSRKYPSSLFITFNGETKTTRAITAHDKLTGITKPPTLRTLEKRGFDGISKSITGNKVEPDGHSYDGSPSWELVLGII